MPSTRLVPVFALALLIAPALAAQQRLATDTTFLQRLLVAEDLRGTGRGGVTPIINGLTSSDTLTRRVAVRAIGRLQRPELARRLYPMLADRVPAIRAEAGTAIAQALIRAARSVSGADSSQLAVRAAASALTDALTVERDPSVVMFEVEALGRLRFGDSASARLAENTIMDATKGRASSGALEGLYWLALSRRVTGPLTRRGVEFLAGAARLAADPVARRIAVLALTANASLDSAVVANALGDSDEQVRRLGLAGITTLSPASRAAAVRAALADSSVIVRVAAIGAARVGSRRPDCGAIIAAVNDPHPYVVQMAIDALGMPCADSAAAATALLRVLDQVPGPERSWQAQGHALVSLARIDRNQVAASLRRAEGAVRAETRGFAAMADSVVGDTAALLRLARDSDHNVVELAITGLAGTARHGADDAYVAGLASPGYQVVRVAANALAGSTQPAAVPALFDNLDRITRERRENSRDPRMAILQRIRELGTKSNASRLAPYLADFDTTVAAAAATILSKWSGSPVTARPSPLPVAPEPLAQILRARNTTLRVTMAPESGGRSFTIRLFNDEAPATVARIVKLVRAHYYDGHVFQRVEPDFVVQGGGPDANEYVGDGPFMRDELTARSHLRGTLGISSRGRDTGDAQWFFNLADNTRLDHEYTVFGVVETGLDVVERILEGERIGSVVVIR